MDDSVSFNMALVRQWNDTEDIATTHTGAGHYLDSIKYLKY